MNEEKDKMNGKTVGDLIREMSNEHLAIWLSLVYLSGQRYKETDDTGFDDSEIIEKWLCSPIEHASVNTFPGAWYEFNAHFGE